ncbi:MAG TPA: NUDIX hydrolase [Paenalcaligenes sp.]|nr:NUDIX hydrolase [Paenalcaligenes sp.]
MSKPAASFYYANPRSLRYCNQCGQQLARIVPPDDNRLRDACEHCGAVHYQNPRCVVGVVPIWGDKVLLCKRAIEPQYNKWTLPAGFMELGETTAQGAMREADEEAGAQLELGSLYTVIDVPHAEQVHFYYLARVLGPQLNPGCETLVADFFTFDQIPWEEIAFRTVSTTLKHLIEDFPSNTFPLRNYAIIQREAEHN